MSEDVENNKAILKHIFGDKDNIDFAAFKIDQMVEHSGFPNAKRDLWDTIYEFVYFFFKDEACAEMAAERIMANHL